MGSSDITQQTFTRFYFDTEKTKKVIEWLIDEWGHELTPHADKVEDIALISSSFRRLCRLILTTRGLTCLGILGKEETLDNFFSEEEKIKSFRKNLETKLFTEKRFTLNDKLKEFFLESIVDYAKFQQPNEKFAEVTKKKKTGSIFQWISSPKYPAYIRIDLLTELAFRKLRKASDDQLFRSSKIRIELQEMIKYGEKIIKKIESDSQIPTEQRNQLFGNPSSSVALFHLRKTLIEVRYNPSPMEIFESALETLKMYKYPKDELRSIYGQIWTYHVIMRVHMFRGDQIQVELYENLIDGMVKGLKENKFPEYQTLGRYLSDWQLTLHHNPGREYKEAMELLKMQEDFFQESPSNQSGAIKRRKEYNEIKPYLWRPGKWGKCDDYSPYNLFALIAYEDKEYMDKELEVVTGNHFSDSVSKNKFDAMDNDKLAKYFADKFESGGVKVKNIIASIFTDELEEMDNGQLKTIFEDNIKAEGEKFKDKLAPIFSEIQAVITEKDRWKKSPHCTMKTGGRPKYIFGHKKGNWNGANKKELINIIPDKLEECIKQLLSSKSPLRISFLRIITREYLIQFTKYACSTFANENREPNYSDSLTLSPNDEKMIVQSFIDGPCKSLQDKLERLSEEFDLMEENIARNEIVDYIECLEYISEPSISKPSNRGIVTQGEQIREKGKMIQDVLKHYVLQLRPNSKLYFPRKYPRTLN